MPPTHSNLFLIYSIKDKEKITLVLFMLFVQQHLSTSGDELSVEASFQQTMWTVGPVAGGGGKTQGYLTGGDAVRLFHGHMDDCLTIAPTEDKEAVMRLGHFAVKVCIRNWKVLQ